MCKARITCPFGQEISASHYIRDTFSSVRAIQDFSLVVAGQEVLIVSDVCDVLFWGLRLVTLIINAAACTNATAHPQRGRHRTTSHTSRSVRSPETCILHPQARRPDTTVPGPRSRLLFLPAIRPTSCRYSTLVGLRQKELLVYFSGKRARPLLILRASTGQRN
jgi:hypothetical protein